MKREQLVSYLNELLEIDIYKDYAPNGLQVEGKPEIQKIITGVTACQALIDVAVKRDADAILVHHGYFWKNEPQQIVGFKQKRIKTLLQNDINLLGYHLPLDGHDEWGNNAQLGMLWGIDELEVDGLVRFGVLPGEMPIEKFVDKISLSLNRQPLHLSGGPEKVQKIAWCSGGAQNMIDKAINLGADVYISGEVSEQTTHLAKECGLHYLAAGHHATETLGVRALGQHLADKFGLEVDFIDIHNPV